MAGKLIISSICDFKGTLITWVLFFKNFRNCREQIKKGENETDPLCWMEKTHINFACIWWHETVKVAIVFTILWRLLAFCLSDKMEVIHMAMGRCGIDRASFRYSDLLWETGLLAINDSKHLPNRGGARVPCWGQVCNPQGRVCVIASLHSTEEVNYQACKANWCFLCWFPTATDLIQL